MKSHSFGQEYNLKYLAGIGSIFNIQEVEGCITDYPLSDEINTSQFYPHYIGVDPGYGHKQHFAIIVLMYIDNQMRVVFHQSYKNPL